MIDEIDKAESDVPNGLLEAFAMRQFTPQGWNEPIVEAEGTAAPVVIVTTNEERMLPDAFVRRCVVLNMGLPEIRGEDSNNRKTTFVDHLIERGRLHFEKAVGNSISHEDAEELY